MKTMIWRKEKMGDREEKFEKMMAAVLNSYDDTIIKMEKLKLEGKVKLCYNYFDFL